MWIAIRPSALFTDSLHTDTSYLFCLEIIRRSTDRRRCCRRLKRSTWPLVVRDTSASHTINSDARYRRTEYGSMNEVLRNRHMIDLYTPSMPVSCVKPGLQRWHYCSSCQSALASHPHGTQAVWLRFRLDKTAPEAFWLQRRNTKLSTIDIVCAADQGMSSASRSASILNGCPDKLYLYLLLSFVRLSVVN